MGQMWVSKWVQKMESKKAQRKVEQLGLLLESPKVPKKVLQWVDW